MKARVLTGAAIAALCAAAAVVGIQSGIAAPVPAVTADVAERADNFQLVDQTRMHHELAYYKNSPAIVLMSYSNAGGFSGTAALEFAKLAASYEDKGVKFFMLNSEIGVTREDVIARLKSLNVDLPVLMDEYQLVGESLGVAREGEIFVIQPKSWQVAYHGPLDNRFEQSNPKTSAKVKAAYAASALDAVLGGASVQQARVDVKAGKAIAFPERGVDHSKISYTNDIAPILADKCVSCHLDGGIAPFAMDSYQVIKGFAPMIRESVRTDRMPPYFADGHIGEFKNDQALTAEQTKTLIHWIEAGAPRGEGEDPLALNARSATDWPESLGEPDYVLNLPAFDVPASGVVEYQNQIVDNPFSDDKWLKAVAFKAGSRANVHHMVSNHMPDRNLKGSGMPSGSVGSYTPGAEAQVMADGAGAPIPGGGKLFFQMHYTTNGQAATDHSQVGFYFADKTPEFIKRSVVIGDSSFAIPAGEANYKEVAYLEFPADAYLYTLYPHAHLRGKNNELVAYYPDGTKEVLISLPKYDFNWQRDYDPKEPIHIPAGTRLVSTWIYDNSADNPANPDPTRVVPPGDQTFDEMMYFRVNYRWADETSENVRNDLEAKLAASHTMGELDDDLDGLVQIDELKGRAAKLVGEFKRLDKDGNGGLDNSELPHDRLGRQQNLDL